MKKKGRPRKRREEEVRSVCSGVLRKRVARDREEWKREGAYIVRSGSTHLKHNSYFNQFIKVHKSVKSENK